MGWVSFCIILGDGAGYFVIMCSYLSNYLDIQYKVNNANILQVVYNRTLTKRGDLYHEKVFIYG